jgi:Zn-dependent protease with chaperone function
MKLPDPRRYFTAEEIDRARRYHRPARRVGWVAAGVSFGLLFVLTFTRTGSWLAAPLDGFPRWAFALSFGALVVLAGAVFRLPFSMWRGHRHEHRWGFSTRGLRSWLADWLKSVALSAALTSVTLLGLIQVASWLPHAWPAVAAPLAAGLVIVLSFLGPVLFEPVFNRFRPLENRALEQELRALAGRARVPVRHVLVSDASRRTRKENAYVSGLARTRRVVVYDTLLARGTDREIKLVVAHELGHWRARHVFWGTALGAAGAVAGVLVLSALLSFQPLLGAIHASGPADPRIAPFVLLIGALGGVLTQPFGVALSRRWERAADRASIELTGDGPGVAEMERNLAVTNLSELDPSKLSYLFRYTHPAPAERIAAAEGERAERPG